MLTVQSKADADAIKAAVAELLALKARLASANPSVAASPARSKHGSVSSEGKHIASKDKEPTAPAPTSAPAAAAPAPVNGPAPVAGDAAAKTPKAAKAPKAKAAPAQPAAGAAAPAAGAAANADLGDAAIFASIDIRVGVIVEAWEHPASDKLWCEKIDVGEAAPREIGSGLRAFYTKEQMTGARVLVVCNLRAAKLGGFASNGMVLCTKTAAGGVQFLQPPAGVAPGTRLVLPGAVGEPASPSQVAKHKIWEKVAEVLRTNADGLAAAGGHVLLVDGQPCQPGPADATIS